MLKEKINKIIQLLNNNDFLNSEIEAKKLLVVHASNFDLNNILGVISVHLNKLDEAVYYFKNCVKIAIINAFSADCRIFLSSTMLILLSIVLI